MAAAVEESVLVVEVLACSCEDVVNGSGISGGDSDNDGGDGGGGLTMGLLLLPA